ncbi:MAG TPA: DUF1264 domain-containing protein [Gemmatimonadales bacterium]|nr:DUF1264 domain-containing protein [Gemmatimonadales bacterium]
MPAPALRSIAVLATLALGGTTAAGAQSPLSGYTVHIATTHWLGERSYTAHHWFKPLRDGVLQGLVFRETVDGAPLIEVEWAIGQAVYDSLTPAERKEWHPLAPAVAAGRVRLPDLAAAEEAKMLETVKTLHAQTINLAGIDGGLPAGLRKVLLATHLAPAER